MPESLWRQWKLFASAVIKHWFFTGGGVVVAILTYVWGQIRHMIYQDGPDIPMWAFYAGALLLIGLGCFLAWRDEHIAKLNEQAQRVLESEAAGVEIARLKADPPVVLFEFPIQDIFRPSMIRTLKASGGYMGHHEEQQLPEIHSVKDNVLNALVRPLDFNGGKVFFDMVVDLGKTRRRLNVHAVRQTLEGPAGMIVQDSMDGLFDVLTEGLQQNQSRETEVCVEYANTAGRRFVTAMIVFAVLDGFQHATIATRWKATDEITPPET